MNSPLFSGDLVFLLRVTTPSIADTKKKRYICKLGWHQLIVYLQNLLAEKNIYVHIIVLFYESMYASNRIGKAIEITCCCGSS